MNCYFIVVWVCTFQNVPNTITSSAVQDGRQKVVDNKRPCEVWVFHNHIIQLLFQIIIQTNGNQCSFVHYQV